MITANNFFAHWLKEISVTKYGSDKELPLHFLLGIVPIFRQYAEIFTL